MDLTVGISYLEYPFQIECQGHPTNPWYGADVIIFAEVHRLEEQAHVECALMEAVLNIAVVARVQIKCHLRVQLLKVMHVLRQFLNAAELATTDGNLPSQHRLRQ